MTDFYVLLVIWVSLLKIKNKEIKSERESGIKIVIEFLAQRVGNQKLFREFSLNYRRKEMWYLVDLIF